MGRARRAPPVRPAAASATRELDHPRRLALSRAVRRSDAGTRRRVYARRRPVPRRPRGAGAQRPLQRAPLSFDPGLGFLAARLPSNSAAAGTILRAFERALPA